MGRKLIDRTGEIKTNKMSLGNYKMKIIKCDEYSNILVEFQDKHKAIVHTNYNSFKNGSVKNPYHPSVFGIGYLGQGKYKSRGEDGNKTKAYKNKSTGLCRWNFIHILFFKQVVCAAEGN